MNKQIRTAFIFDYLSDLDEEIKGAIMEIDGFCGFVGDKHLPIKIVEKSQALTIEILKTPYDLLIMDYGGVSVMGGSSNASVQVSAACQYAEDHPSCLVVIWTGYTAEVYQDELKDQFGHLNNIVCRYKPGHVYENLDGSPEFIKKFKAWFGID